MAELQKRDNYYGFDLAKVILCICVVAIHTMGAYGIYPFLRIAVPMFFCISSFLFFRKLDETRDRAQLFKFLSRNTKLYVFWFLVLLLPTLTIGGWLKGNLIRNAIKFCLKIFVNSTFASSWYIPALMISVVIVFFLKRILPNWLLLLGTFLIYAFCCIASNYRGLFNENSIVNKLVIAYPGTIYNSFPVGILWVAMGYCLADGGVFLNKQAIYIGEIASLILLLVEYWLVDIFGCSVDNDCYFMLIPVCYFLMMILVDVNIVLNPTIAKRMRNTSTIIYCLHGTVASVLKARIFVGSLSFADSMALFAITLVFSGMVAGAILSLENRSYFKWLKYAH